MCIGLEQQQGERKSVRQKRYVATTSRRDRRPLSLPRASLPTMTTTIFFKVSRSVSGIPLRTTTYVVYIAERDKEDPIRFCRRSVEISFFERYFQPLLFLPHGYPLCFSFPFRCIAFRLVVRVFTRCCVNALGFREKKVARMKRQRDPPRENTLRRNNSTACPIVF